MEPLGLEHVSPVVPALLLALSWVLACWGWSLLRERVPASLAGPPPAPPRRAAVEREGPIKRAIAVLSDRLAPRALALLGERQIARIRRRLDAAGRPQGMTVAGYAGRKSAFTLAMIVPALMFLVGGRWLLALMSLVLGWLSLDVWLAGEARRRQAQIDRELPDFLDVLAVTVAAGVGFRPALQRVAEALGGALGEEMLIALRQIELGASRREAFQGVRDRNESERLSQFVTSLLQAEELGVPLADALTELAADMRRGFHQDARRRAARAAPRVSLIVSILIVPGAVIATAAALFIGSDFSLGRLLGE